MSWPSVSTRRAAPCTRRSTTRDASCVRIWSSSASRLEEQAMADPARNTRLKALLGPSGPELTCEQCFEQLDLYVEQELAGSDAERSVPGMRAHLEGCPACPKDHESLRALVASADLT